ncbi:MULTISPECIES: transposase DNA-binding-containing protein [unclassified Nostoc]|uniref:IS4/Tn5 family transposase DNA-binding protein n=1 Tax=unclassified Nostoc TaxID=2593658 RepID=UPI00391AF1A4
MQEWATEELKQADSGDARHTKRLIRIVEDLSAQPASSVPQACGNTLFQARRYSQCTHSKYYRKNKRT